MGEVQMHLKNSKPRIINQYIDTENIFELNLCMYKPYIIKYIFKMATYFSSQYCAFQAGVSELSQKDCMYQGKINCKREIKGCFDPMQPLGSGICCMGGQLSLQTFWWDVLVSSFGIAPQI